jgi:hypothetical protein
VGFWECAAEDLLFAGTISMSALHRTILVPVHSIEMKSGTSWQLLIDGLDL